MDLETGKSPGDILDGQILAHVIEGAPVGFGMHDADGKVTYVNRSLAELLGFDDARDVIGREVESLLIESDRAEYRKLIEDRPDGQMDPYSLTLTRRDGSEVRALISPVPIVGADGELVASAAFIMDVAQLGAAGAPPATPATPGLDEAQLDQLTTREREVFDRLIEGRSVRDIAEVSFISEHTVRNHIKSIYRKLGLHSRLDLLRAVLGR